MTLTHEQRTTINAIAAHFRRQYGYDIRQDVNGMRTAVACCEIAATLQLADFCYSFFRE